VLVIALACPALRGPAASRSRTVALKDAQSILARLYVVVASICADLDIVTDMCRSEAGSVDVGVLLVDHEHGRRYEREQRDGSQGNSATALDLRAFAAKVQPWQTVLQPISEEGYGLLSTYHCTTVCT